MDEYNAALESFREKNKDCIVKQLDYGECMQVIIIEQVVV